MDVPYFPVEEDGNFIICISCELFFVTDTSNADVSKIIQM